MDSCLGTLFVVATPIGNLGDCTQRAIEILSRCSTIACEDTRTSSHLLHKFGIHAQLIAYHDRNEQQQTTFLLKKLQSGESIAVICDAGTPTISDPGFRIVRECQKLGIPVAPIPGANAAITALSASGLPTDRFLFLGFPGHKASTRRQLLETYCHFPATLIFHESCYRIQAFLNDIQEVMGAGRFVTIGKELTKIHETIFTKPIGQIVEKIDSIGIKGEFVVLIAPENFQL